MGIVKVSIARVTYGTGPTIVILRDRIAFLPVISPILRGEQYRFQHRFSGLTRIRVHTAKEWKYMACMLCLISAV